MHIRIDHTDWHITEEYCCSIMKHMFQHNKTIWLGHVIIETELWAYLDVSVFDRLQGLERRGST